MKARHVYALVLFTLFFITYPGTHFLYTFEMLHPEAFGQVVRPEPRFPYPIPIVRGSAIAPKVTGQGVYIVDLPSWTVVSQRHAEDSFYPASTTKMITALTVVKYLKPTDIISVHVASREGQLMNLREGERMTVENLLYGMLVYSANDAAYALGETSGGQPDFVQKMNETALQLGMTGSHFTNPAGLDEPEMRTTPRDLALAARAILADPLLRKMVSTRSISILDEDFRYTHNLTNVNQLLGVLDGLGGVKTGQTGAAGQNLVSYYKVPGQAREYIIVVLKSQDRFGDTQEITNWLQTSVEHVDLN